MSCIDHVRHSTATISRSIDQRGSELVDLDRLFTVAANVAKLSPAQIQLHSETLSSMLATTKGEIATLSTNKRKIVDDLGKAVQPMTVGNNSKRDRANDEIKVELQQLLPPIEAAGRKAATLLGNIEIVQRKIVEDKVPTASRCPSLPSLNSALTYVATAVVSIASFALFQWARS